MRQVKVSELTVDDAADLQLRLLAGQPGLNRNITLSKIQKPGLALTGYTEFVQKGRVQILGSTELTYLEKLPVETRLVSCRGFCACDIPVVICTKGMRVPDELVSAAQETQTPLFTTPQGTDVFISRVESWLD